MNIPGEPVPEKKHTRHAPVSGNFACYRHSRGACTV